MQQFNAQGQDSLTMTSSDPEAVINLTRKVHGGGKGRNQGRKDLCKAYGRPMEGLWKDQVKKGLQE